jgi:hypothetical protein
MRIFMIAALLFLCESASAGTMPQGFPRDVDSLRSLDSQQLRIVRRAGALCWHSGFGGVGTRGVMARACVIQETEGAIANLKDPVLKAYNDALPMNARYSEYRPAYYWQRLVLKS